jgi:hypothetical protein
MHTEYPSAHADAILGEEYRAAHGEEYERARKNNEEQSRRSGDDADDDVDRSFDLEIFAVASS